MSEDKAVYNFNRVWKYNRFFRIDFFFDLVSASASALSERKYSKSTKNLSFFFLNGFLYCTISLNLFKK